MVLQKPSMFCLAGCHYNKHMCKREVGKVVKHSSIYTVKKAELET